VETTFDTLISIYFTKFLYYMKNVLMTLLFLGGFAATQLSAQSCKPSPLCPPGCCIEMCKADGKACKLEAKACKGEAAVVCTPAQIEACKAAVAANPGCLSGETAVAGVTMTTESAPATKASQPACCVKGEKKKAVKLASAQ
jgi:hypothetical protein